MKLEYRMCHTLSPESLDISHYVCDDMSVKKSQDRTYSECSHKKQRFKDHPCYGYMQLYYGNDPFLYVTTPTMKCLFGIKQNYGSNFEMCLQFNDLESDPVMKQFYEFIETVEFVCMKHLGLSADEEDRFVSQIKYDKERKYEPKINVKVPFTYNQFQTDVYTDADKAKDKSVNLLSIPKFTNMECDIYLDKIWRMNGKFYAKWKCRCIHIV